ncbi:MAG: hypothetical protein JWN98_593 [Abditibacteriota bacterium]|nr:hypothetical protein [Abditibacteriota bacterium]
MRHSVKFALNMGRVLGNQDRYAILQGYKAASLKVVFMRLPYMRFLLPRSTSVGSAGFANRSSRRHSSSGHSSRLHPRLPLAWLLACLSALLLMGFLVRPAQTETGPRMTGSSGKLSKFEPARGCYLGAFIERDFTVLGDISAFEQLTKKKHASYFTYVGYGRPFPSDWVRKVKAGGAAPHIAFEPNDGLDMVQDGAYIRAWARDAARAKCPIFLRWASEMNGPWTKYGPNPPQYVEKFRLISKVMKEEAPNVAMVWTPFAEPTRTIPSYYPGDEWVDWVGMNIYSVYVNNGDPFRPADQKDPVEALRYIYENYADRKPVHISEFAATIYCKGTSSDTVSFAISKMTRFYDALRLEFPRVKSVNWFCWDTIRANRANNNYSILDDGRVLATYRKLVSDEHFLSQVHFDPNEWPQIPQAGTTLGPEGITLGGASGDELLTATGAIAGTLQSPWLRGLEPGARVRGDLDLTAQLPVGLEPRGLLWQVDGRTVALTNTQPYRVSIPRERLGPGPHVARVVVLPKTDTTLQLASPGISFEVIE